jgi:hypothetical protein
VKDDTITEKDQQTFVNNGPGQWLSPFLDVFGMKEGKSLMYAIPMDVDKEAANKVSPEESARLQKDATKNLYNIGIAERERRNQASKVTAVISVVYVVWASLIADDGGIGGHVLRFLSILPLFFTFGFKLSAETGL